MLTFVLVVAVLIGTPILLFIAMNWLAPMPLARFLLRQARKKAKLVERSITIGDFTMPYLEGGRGEPVVLVHGFGGSRDNFLLMAGFLVPHFRVLVPDLPGFGDASKNPDANYTTQEQARRLHLWMKAVGLNKAHFAGNSMGGWIVAELALLAPDQVASLLLLNAAGIQAGGDNELGRRFRESGEMPLLVHSLADYDRLMSLVMSKPPKMPRAIRVYGATQAMANASLHQRIAAMFKVPENYLDVRGAAIAAPTLIVWGEEDQVVAPAAVPGWQKICANVRTCLLPGIGHLPMIEAPKQVAGEYMAFLHGLPAPAQTPR